MERTEAITILENERCRKIYAMQHRPQIFFQKDNICAAKSNLENIKIVSDLPSGAQTFHYIPLFLMSHRKPMELHWFVSMKKSKTEDENEAISIHSMAFWRGPPTAINHRIYSPVSTATDIGWTKT